MIAVGDLLVLKSRSENFAPGWDSSLSESCWMSPDDVFIFLGVAEKWTDQAGSRWYGIVLRARDEKVLVFPDYCFEPCHPN